MKKTYKNPTLKVVKINTQHVMIGASKDYEGGDIQSRRSRFSKWEEEEEEE